MTALYREGTPQITLLDVLDKVLDKGLVVAGDIRVSVASVELLTIKVRLLICSVDKAVEIGMDWWRQDDYLSSGAAKQTAELQARIEALERQLATSTLPGAASELPAQASTPAGRQRRSRRRSNQ